MNTAKGMCNYLLMTALMLSCAFSAQAAAPREGGDQALRQAQVLLQKLSAEKTALEKENLRLTDELKKMQDDLASTNKKLSTSENQNAQVLQRNASLMDRVRTDSEHISNLTATYRKEIGDARSDIQLLRNAVLERNAWTEDCRAKNEGLYETNVELLQVYRNKGAWDALAQREPITGISSVKVENTVQEFQFRLEDLRTVKFESEVARKAMP